MSEGVFLVRDDNQLIEMRSAAYDTEELLQRLLATHPSLIAGDAVDPTAPRRWLLISREQSVPGEEGGAGRWSLDHLFLDQDGVPTLVEVKRATDTRARREVVAQMLDYAANGVAYWPLEELRAQLEKTASESGISVEEAIAGLIGNPEADQSAFWRNVDVNLRAGRIRMIFVADYIHPELRRIVEFLNAQMDPAEVLALEIRQFVGGGMRTLVPTLVGRTAEAERRKSSGVRPPPSALTVEDWFARAQQRFSPSEFQAAREIEAWWRRMGADVAVTSAADPSLLFRVHRAGQSLYPAFIKSNGKTTVSVWNFMNKPPYDQFERRQEVVNEITAAFDVVIGPKAVNGEPGVPLKLLTTEQQRQKLYGIWQKFMDDLQ